MNKKELSERDICSKFITPALEQAGWDIATQNHGDPEELMQEYLEIARQLEAAQAALKQELMQALGGRDKL